MCDSIVKKHSFLALILGVFLVFPTFISYANFEGKKAANKPNLIVYSCVEKEVAPEIKAPVNEYSMFVDTVKFYAKKLGVPYTWLLAITSHESENTATAKNPYSSATGILQFTKSTAKLLGTSISAIKKMSRIQQVRYVYKYFMIGKEKYGNYNSLTQMYIFALLPNQTPYHNKPYHVLMKKGDSYYAGNSGLDTDNNGSVQVFEITNRINKRLK